MDIKILSYAGIICFAILVICALYAVIMIASNTKKIADELKYLNRNVSDLKLKMTGKDTKTGIYDDLGSGGMQDGF